MAPKMKRVDLKTAASGVERNAEDLVFGHVNTDLVGLYMNTTLID